MNDAVVIPKHVAVICDGNRRWAKEHKLEVFMGHRHAVEGVFEPVIERAQAHGVEYLTFWVFSTENWQRDEREVSYLLDLFSEAFEKAVPRLHEKNIRIRTIGNISAFPKKIQQEIARAVALTETNAGITVVFAMNYGGRDELLRALPKLCSVERGLDPETTTVQWSREAVSAVLDTAGIPDPDFIIRTGGEQRLSGFMLWQSEYAELAFPSFYFPEFSPEKLDELLADYAQRKRRFGK